MRRIPSTIAFATISLLSVCADARAERSAAGLRQAQNLVTQGRTQLQVVHRRHPHGYGGHDVKAERFLRMASRELSEAEVYRKYNRGKS